MPADRRYLVGFTALAGGGAHLRVPVGAGTQVWRVGGDHAGVERLGLPGALAGVAPWRVVPLADGRVAGIEADRMMLWDREGGPGAVPLPDGFTARDVCAADHGGLWVCGSARRADGRSRRAWAVRRPDGSWEARLGAGGALRDAWRAALAGATGEFRSIRRAGGWLVLAAEGGEPGDSSAFVFARDPRGRWHSEVLARDVLREAVADGHGIAAFTHRGRVVRFGRRRRARPGAVPGLVDAVTAAGLPARTAGARVEVLGVAAGPPVLLLAAVRLGSERAGEAVVPYGQGAAGVGPAIALQRPPEPEVVAVAASPS